MKVDVKKNFFPLAIGFVSGMAVILMFFGLSHWLWKWQLKAEQARLWEIILKAVAGVLAISGAIVAVLRYLDEKAELARKHEEDQETIARNRRKDFDDQILAMRQDVYTRLIKTMAKLINRDPPDTDWFPLQDMFFELYWGELRYVWSKEVEETSGAYSDALFAYEKGPKDKLIALGNEVVRACRKSLREPWDAPREVIPENPLKIIDKIRDSRKSQPESPPAADLA